MVQIKIGRFIQTRRTEKGITQARPASKIGAGDRAVSKWENGRGLPLYEYIQSLCSESDITFNEFISGEKIAENNEIKPEENPVSSCKESGKSFRQLLTVKGILLIIGTIIILPVSMFLVDAHQMRNGRPAVFSVWGLKYYPSVGMHEPEPEKAVRDSVYEEQEEQTVKREPVSAKGSAELNTFCTEADRVSLEYKVSAWVLEEIYCGKDVETVKNAVFLFRICLSLTVITVPQIPCCRLPGSKRRKPL